MLFLKYKADFTVEEMVQMENELKFSVLGTKELSPDNADLAGKLGLQVEYVSDLEDDNEAELCQTNNSEFLGLIRLRKELKKYKFAYIHEIIHYVFDVGCGNKVTSSFARKRKGKTDSRDEQRINYKTAAYIMPYEEILKALQEYDKSFPKMNAIQFVRKLQETFEQSETAVIRRIKEVRRISKRAAVR
ncbi:ImmA/IrrE family metallo-endopeptidase [Anaerotruncus colihominis]|uniref:ImmA/IrrE family metallo-endopeptidase n=1 Tax=Anaerotruncus colihominis TaxID=169435 RepID=UPI00189719DC|nr:ImmA/IrrE family metallo-endopeptidase [Anaerotruncus colihominis]